MRKTILVLFGGCSSEHGVSLQSAQAVLERLDRSKYQPLTVGITRTGQWLCYRGPASAIGDGSWEQSGDGLTPCALAPDRDRHQLLLLGDRVSRLSFDAAFPVLHGKNGEDGTVQGLLELAGIPVVGCGALSSALCMDKDRAHKLAALAGIDVPRGTVFRRGASPCSSSRCGRDHPAALPKPTDRTNCPPQWPRPSATTGKSSWSKPSPASRWAAPCWATRRSLWAC